MNRNTLLTLCAMTALGLVMASPVSAATVTWDGDPSVGSATDWHNGTNWDTNSVPGSSDDVVIPDVTNDPTISNNDATINKLTVNSGAMLTITGKTLTLGGAVTHDIDGQVKLSNSSAKLVFTADATVDGDGAIIGQDNAAEIRIAASKTLTNEMVINGQLKLMNDSPFTAGTFKNGSTGIVRADAADGVLSFASGLTLADETACSPSWEAITNTGAVLEFNQAATNLVGTFVLDDCAKMRFNANITTAGKLVDSSAGSPQGFVDIENSSTFTFRTVCDGGSPVSYTTDQTLGSCP